ncbi:MAG: hypothetical protein ABEJ68_09535 [Halobacteriaceae archaeon]
MAATQSWSDPNECPFCGERLESPGEGFMIHIEESPDCDADFDTWRDRVSGDMAAGWSG